MKRKAFFLLMLTSLLVSILLIGISTGTAPYPGYVPGADTKYKVQIDSPYYNATSNGLYWVCPPPDIGDNFNVTVYIENVSAMIGYVVTMVWNNSICTSTGNIWDYNIWGTPTAGLLGFSYTLGNSSDIGYVDSAANGLKATHYQYNFTDNTATQHPVFTLELHIEAEGNTEFYIYKQTGTREGQMEYILLALTPTGWVSCGYGAVPPTPIGKSEDYDVIWLVVDDFNADMFTIPEFLAHLFIALFLIATMIAVVLGKTVWSKRLPT